MKADSVGYLIWHVSNRWRAAADRALAEHGLTHAQYVALAELHDLGRTTDGRTDPPSQQTLARTSGLGVVYVSKLVRTLESKSLIHRTPDARDSRTVRLFLTDTGLATVRAAARTMRGLETRLLEPLGGRSSPERHALAHALRRLLEDSDA